METLNGCEENQRDVDLDHEPQEIIDAVLDEATKKALIELAVRFRKKKKLRTTKGLIKFSICTTT